MAILRHGRNMKHSVGVLLLSAATLAVSLGGTSTAAAQHERSGLAAPIEGTWIFTIHRVKQDLTFTAFQSFTAGGVTLATGTADRTPPPPISPLIGSWKRMHGDQYGATLCFFIFDTEGKPLHMFKNYLTLSVTNKDTLEGGGDADLCDPDGSNCVIFDDQITIVGERLVAQGARF
jgi:hypothetical protein